MQRVETQNSTTFIEKGRELRMMWEVLTLSAPEGARVVVVDMSRPSGKRIIFDKEGAEHELRDLKLDAEAMITAELGI